MAGSGVGAGVCIVALQVFTSKAKANDTEYQADDAVAETHYNRKNAKYQHCSGIRKGNSSLVVAEVIIEGIVFHGWQIYWKNINRPKF